MSKDSRSEVDRLLKGISTEHVETVRDAWREILKGGVNSVSQIQVKLASSVWAEYPRGPSSKYFGVLLSVLDEVDPSAFENEVARLRKSELHPTHRKTLEVLSQRIQDKPAIHVGNDVPVYVASDIVDRSAVIGNIERWCKTRGLSLDNVTRIDVIASRPELYYLGMYNMFFSRINLTWPASPLRRIRHWSSR